MAKSFYLRAKVYNEFLEYFREFSAMKFDNSFNITNLGQVFTPIKYY